MDPSALIFVALVVAWAVYLVPKSLEHRDRASEAGASWASRFLGRGRSTQEAEDESGVRYVDIPIELSYEQRLARRAASRSATKRRRNVLSFLLLGLVAVAAVAAFEVIAWTWLGIPGGLLAAWLVACRLTVRREIAVPMQRVRAMPAPADDAEESSDRLMVVDDDGQPTGSFVAIDPETSVGRWDPVQVPLPSYVSAPAASREVGSLDHDSTGVWSSGRNDADSAIAREADEAAAAARAEQAADHRQAAGS